MSVGGWHVSCCLRHPRRKKWAGVTSCARDYRAGARFASCSQLLVRCDDARDWRCQLDGPKQ